jgi:hypothetical protein
MVIVPSGSDASAMFKKSTHRWRCGVGTSCLCNYGTHLEEVFRDRGSVPKLSSDFNLDPVDPSHWLSDVKLYILVDPN